MARSKPPRRYPSYRSAHYVSRTPCRPRLSQKGLRARSTDESIKDERGISQYREREARGGGDESNENGTNGINKTKEQTAGYIRDTRSSFKAFHLLVTNGWLLGATEFRGAFGPRSRERDLLRRFRVTRFFIRTYVAAHDNFSFSMRPAAAPRTSNFPHPHFLRVFNLLSHYV